MNSITRPDVLFLSHSHQMIGGGEHSLVAIVEDLHKNGIEVVVGCVGNGTLPKRLKAMGIDCVFLPTPWWIDEQSEETKEYNAHSIEKWVEYIQTNKPKICITNTLASPVLAYAASMANIPHVWFIREFGSLDHGMVLKIDEESVHRTVDELSTKVFFNSKSTQDYFAKDFIHNKKTEIVFPKVDSSFLDINTENPFRKSSAIKLIIVGHVQPGKGQLEAIKAVGDLKKNNVLAELVIIGGNSDEEYLDEINNYITKNGLEDLVSILGAKPDAAAYFKHADIALVCSRNEAFGRVTIEAMMSGVPVIGAHSGGTAEIIKDGVNGALYQPGDHIDLSKKIMNLMDAKKRESISKNAKRYVGDNFNPKTINDVFINRIKELIKSPNSGLNLSPLTDLLLLRKIGAREQANEHNEELQKEITKNQKLSSELKQIKESRTWRMRSYIARLVNRT